MAAGFGAKAYEAGAYAGAPPPPVPADYPMPGGEDAVAAGEYAVPGRVQQRRRYDVDGQLVADTAI